MYDITKRESFENLIKWVHLINESAPIVPLVLIWNKLNDEEDNRIVRAEEGKAFAKENGYLFYESRALNGKNVNNAIYAIRKYYYFFRKKYDYEFFRIYFRKFSY